MTPLRDATLSSLPPSVQVPRYGRRAVTPGIVHFGVGGFHRAHEAVYCDDLLGEGGNEGWGICGVGLRPADRAMRDALAPQDGLYTVVTRDAAGDQARVIGSLVRYLFAPEETQAVQDALAAPETRIVSLTITEGGYSAEQGDAPRSVWEYLADGLNGRRARGLPPFTVLSCDNLPGNGDAARDTLLAVAARRDPALRDWIGANVAFPNSMVDRITPQTTDADRALVRATGIGDAWPVVCEPFRQWIMEDTFSADRPPWERAGAQFVPDVRPYEAMKLRLLNGGHSAIGYLGFLAGFGYIHEIVGDPLFRSFLQRLVDDEVTPLLAPVPGIDLVDYKATLLTRFANPVLRDQTSRICLDGSSKMPKFILPSVRDALASGRPCRLLTLAVAGWLRYLNGLDEQGRPFPVDDPMAARLQQRAREGGPDPRPLLGLTDLFSDLALSEPFVRQLEDELASLYAVGARATLAGAMTR